MSSLQSVDPGLGSDLLVRLVINMVSILALVRLYFQVTRHRENAAAFMLFGVGVFFVTNLLHNTEVSMGFAFGLFAVFSMLRYRTEALGIKEMTWLFLVIAVALLSAVAPLAYYELLGMNFAILGIAFLLETRAVLPLRQETKIEYEKIENIHPDRREVLIADLRARTGLDVIDVEVSSISFLKDTAVIRVHYRGSRSLSGGQVAPSSGEKEAC